MRPDGAALECTALESVKSSRNLPIWVLFQASMRPGYFLFIVSYRFRQTERRPNGILRKTIEG